MSKNSTNDFLSKFANRVEKVGRDGVMGLMKSTGLPINNQNYDNIPNYSSFNNKNNFIILIIINDIRSINYKSWSILFIL